MINTINIDNLSFKYAKHPIFQGLSTRFMDSEFCAIMGPNGSGKSTLLKCIGGMLPFQEGEIKVNGQHIDQYESVEFAKLVSYVAQYQDNVFDVRVYDLVMMGLYPYQKKWQSASCQDHQIVCTMLDRCHLYALKDRMLSELSGGELQRARIARAMAQQTPIMLLDEPLSNLDVAHKYEIMDILKTLNQQGVMILIILHDFSVAIEYATHALLMKEGVMVQHDSTKKVLSPENLRKCFQLSDEFKITDKGFISKYF